MRVNGPAASTCIVGLAGTFDVASYGDQLLPRLAERELGARLPLAEFRRFAPFGWEHPTVMDGGMMAEPLGRPTAQRRAELADQLDALVIGGGELIHDRDDLLAAKYRADAEETIERAPTRWFIEGVGPELEPRCPTLWHGVGVPGDLSGETAARVCRSLAGRAYVSVRDERSLARLVAAGAEGAISIVPDSGFLVPRLFPLPVLQRRRALHHMMGWLPVGDYVVVQGNRSILNQVGQLCSALHTVLDRHPGLSLVTLETGPGDGEAAFSAAVRAAMVGVCSMPEALVPEDVASVIEGARGVVSISMQASITAMAFQRPTVIANLGGRSNLTALAELVSPMATCITDITELPAALHKALGVPCDGRLVRELQADIDRHFDRMAEVIEQSSSTGGDVQRAQRRSSVVAAELGALRRAHAVRGRQLSAERMGRAITLDAERAALDALRSGLAAADERLVEFHENHAEFAAAAQNQLADVSTRLVEAEHRQQLLQQTIGDLEQQLLLTEAALDAVHRTKLFRLARWPRKVFGWFAR